VAEKLKWFAACPKRARQQCVITPDTPPCAGHP
jgi:hypothetical protein